MLPHLPAAARLGQLDGSLYRPKHIGPSVDVDEELAVLVVVMVVFVVVAVEYVVFVVVAVEYVVVLVV